MLSYLPGHVALGLGLSSGPGRTASNSTAQVSMCPAIPAEMFLSMPFCLWFLDSLAAKFDLSLTGSVIWVVSLPEFQFLPGYMRVVVVSSCGGCGM